MVLYFFYLVFISVIAVAILSKLWSTKAQYTFVSKTKIKGQGNTQDFTLGGNWNCKFTYLHIYVFFNNKTRYWMDTGVVSVHVKAQLFTSVNAHKISLIFASPMLSKLSPSVQNAMLWILSLQWCQMQTLSFFWKFFFNICQNFHSKKGWLL